MILLSSYTSFIQRYNIENFIKEIVLLVENQDSTQDLIVEILCLFTSITQEGTFL